MTATYVFVDTNILVFCSMGTRAKHEPLLLKTLFDALESTGAVLLLPDVVELEYLNLMRTRGELYRKASENARTEALKNLSAETDKQKVAAVFAQINDDRAAAMKEAGEHFEALAGSKHTVRIASTGDMVARALTYSIGGRAPSKGKTARERADLTPSEPGYTVEPDCLIVAALAAQLSSADPKPRLIFCTDNIKDFAQTDQETGEHSLHPEVAAEMPCEVSFFRTLPELLEHGLVGEALSEGAKELYADAVNEAVALTAQLTGVKAKESTFCPSCSTKVGVEMGVLPGSTVHPVCPVCGLGFFVHRANDGAVFARRDGTSKAKSQRIACPECGNRILLNIKPGETREVARVCFDCQHRLVIDTESLLVTGSSKAEALEAAIVRTEGDRSVVQCPLCDRKLRTIGKSEAGEFAICNSEAHGPQLLHANASIDTEGDSG